MSQQAGKLRCSFHGGPRNGWWDGRIPFFLLQELRIAFKIKTNLIEM